MRKVIIADNSAIFKGFIRDILEQSGDFSIIKMTANGEDIVCTHQKEYADLIVIADNINLMDEKETSKLILKNNPTCVIVLTNDLNSRTLNELKQVGDFHVLKRPSIDELQNAEFSIRFIEDIKACLTNQGNSQKLMNSLKDKYKGISVGFETEKTPLIVMGASTGGPKTIQHIIEKIPEDFPVGIALVQHFEEGFEKGFVDWLNGLTKLTVRLALNKDFPKPGEMIIAPQGLHLKAEGNYLVLADGAKVNNQKPAVDVLFSTAASVYKDKLIGVLLTGMGKDGADGCLDIVKNGGYTIVQDKESSVVYGMPKEAIELNAASIVLPFTSIAEHLIKITGNRA